MPTTFSESNPPETNWSNAKIDDFTEFLMTYPMNKLDAIEDINQIVIDYANIYGDEYDNPPGKNFVDGYGHGYGGAKYNKSTEEPEDPTKSQTKKKAKAKFHDRLRKVERGFKKGADWLGDNVFTSRNMFYLFLFIIVYLAAYFIVKSVVDVTYGKSRATEIMQNLGDQNMFGYGSSSASSASGASGASAMDTCGSTHCLSLLILEVILWSAFLIYSFLLYYKVSKNDAERFFENLVRYLLSDHFDYSGLLMTGGTIILFYVLVAMSGVPVFGDSRPFTIMFFETLLWTVFTVLMFSFGINHIFHVNLGDLLLGHRKKKNGVNGNGNENKDSSEVVAYEDDDPNSSLSSTTVGGTTTTKVSRPASKATVAARPPTIQPPKVSKSGKMTFLDGYYNYVDAQEICHAKGGHLATYKELQETESSGDLEWCKIGWSADQVGAFVNKTKACGKKGINASMIDNPEERHGINCVLDATTNAKEGFDTLIPRMSELDKSIEFATKNHSFGNGWMKI